MTLQTLTLDQERVIDRLKEDLVPAAEAFLDRGEVIRLSKKKFGDSQLRNLIAIANETESPAVVLNFIRYQIGRDSKGHNWASSFADKSLGQLLIDDLETGAVKTALDQVPGTYEDKITRQLASMRLIRQYLGFASRYLKYLELKRTN